MEQIKFEALVKALCEKSSLPEALALLKESDEPEVAEAAESLTGQFSLAEIDGAKRIYHVVTEADEQGEDQEYVEWVMNEGDDVIKFVSWFFYAIFEIKHKDTYAAVGRTYQQPKRL